MHLPDTVHECKNNSIKAVAIVVLSYLVSVTATAQSARGKKISPDLFTLFSKISIIGFVASTLDGLASGK